MTLAEPKFWTYEDYLTLPDDGQRYEILDGVLYVCPSPLPIHQIVSKRLFHFLCQLELQGKGCALSAPLDVLMPGCTPVQPDLIFLLPEQFGQIGEKNLTGAPHLIAEVLSPSNASFDRVKKLRKYAAAGVTIYLIVDPRDQVFQVFSLSDGHYRVQEALAPGDQWNFMGIQLDIAALFSSSPTLTSNG